MKAGNASYTSTDQLPESIPVFPLSEALLLPGGQMPLNIFEPRYLAMIEDAMKSNRLIGMIQPEISEGAFNELSDSPALCRVGCVGRIVAHQELGEQRFAIHLSGIARFYVDEEIGGKKGYRYCKVSYFAEDLIETELGESGVDRDELILTLRAYLDSNDLEADWDGIHEAPTDALVNALAMMSPFGAAEKQALLEAPDLKTRADTLIALTEISLVKDSDTPHNTIQ
jgi:Lon protease-like protein